MEAIDKLFGLTIFVMVAVVFVPLERLVPFHGQRVLRRNWKHDLTFWVLNHPMVYVGGLLMIVGAVFLNQQVVPQSISAGIGDLSLWASVPLAILLSDMTFYFVHRASHAFPVLWQFHAVHHSIRDLDWLAGIRAHPADQLITTVSGLSLLVALGFSAETLAITSAIYLWQSNAAHCNVRIPLGPLARVIVGPRFHHWHHSTNPLARDRNFAGQLAFLDWIFGTAYDPADRLPVEYGADDPVPDSYAGAFAYPIKRLYRMAKGSLDEVTAPKADV